jgi:hypothetical protein
MYNLSVVERERERGRQPGEDRKKRTREGEKREREREKVDSQLHPSVVLFCNEDDRRWEHTASSSPSPETTRSASNPLPVLLSASVIYK